MKKIMKFISNNFFEIVIRTLILLAFITFLLPLSIHIAIDMWSGLI